MANTLMTYSKLPELNTITILLVGTQGIGKHTLAKTLVDINTAYSLQVRIASHLPLPTDGTDATESPSSRPRIDFIAFILDVNNKMSISSIESSVRALDVSYFLGHVCFVALNAADELMQVADMKDITGMCDAYDSPMLCGSLKDETQKKCLGRKILKLAETSAGFNNGVSPLLLQTTKRAFEFVEPL